jgi:rhodanese-related sulfurtransferase
MNEVKSFPELSVKEVAELIAQGAAVVIDVNPRRRWASGHVPGAINLDPAEFTESDIPGDKTKSLVFYCSDTDCGASRYAARKAAKMGFVHVFTMPAGIRGWLAEGQKAMSAR